MTMSERFTGAFNFANGMGCYAWLYAHKPWQEVVTLIVVTFVGIMSVHLILIGLARLARRTTQRFPYRVVRVP